MGENRSWEEAMAPSKMVMDSVCLSSWLHLWARLSKGSHGIDDFPIWVQLIPRMIFSIICAKNDEAAISRDSLRNFYKKFSGLDGETLEKVALRDIGRCQRTVTTSWTTKATNSSSPISSWEEQYMDLENTSSAVLTTET